MKVSRINGEWVVMTAAREVVEKVSSFSEALAVVIDSERS